MTQYRDQLLKAIEAKSSNMTVLIKDTAKSREALKLKLEEGKDQLIEINSHSTEVSTELIGKIRGVGKVSRVGVSHAEIVRPVRAGCRRCRETDLPPY